MPKKILLAPAAGGKSRAVLKLARQTAHALQAEVRVCVPTGLQANAWRENLATAGGALGVHILTFDGLVTACLNAAGEAYTELSDPVQFRLLRALINRLPLEHYAPLKNKPGFVQVVREVISELKAALILPQKFREGIAGLGGAARLRELADIYAAYQEQLQNERWADREGLLWLAVEALQKRAPDCCRAWPLLIIDGFDDFNPAQRALLSLLADRVGDFMITLPQAEQVPYPRYEDTRRKVEKMLGDEAEVISEARRPATSSAAGLSTPDAPLAPLQHLSRHIFSLSPAASVPAGEALTLRETAERTAEVRTALRWLKQRLVLDGSSPGDLALLARDINPYRPVIRQVAAEFGLPIRLVDGLPLRHNPLIAALMELLRLFIPVAPGGEALLPRRQVISSWRSPYFSWANDALAIGPPDADRLDKFARDQRVIRGLSQWQDAFAAGRSARDQEAVEEEEGFGQTLSGTAVRALEEKFNYFITATQPPPEATSMHDFVAWLEGLIGPDEGGDNDPVDSGLVNSGRSSALQLNIIQRARANPETAAADIAALKVLKEILRGLVWAEEAVREGGPVDYLTFFNELNGALQAAQFTLPEQTGRQEILVADSPQVRGLSFEAVALMGLSEGSFPATISEDPFLRDADRLRLRTEYDLLLKPSTISAEREYFYEAITRARQKLLLTRPILAENGAEWVASPYWEAVQRLVAAPVEAIPAEALLPLAETASRAEWWESMAAAEVDHERLEIRDDRAWRRIETAAHIWQARARSTPTIWNGALDDLAVDLSTRYGSERTWSASRLEAYRSCSFLFFTQYVLHLAPRPEPAEGLDTRQLGSLYHHIFERVTGASELDVEDEEQVRATVSARAAPILDAAPEEEGFRETPWWRHTRAEIIDHIVTSIRELAAGAFQFFEAERRFGISDTPLIISNGEDQLRLRGIIDRIDRDAHGRLRIIDYKLGGPYSFRARDFQEGKRLQLPLYALAAQEALKLGEVAEGFYWHFRQAEASPFQLSKGDGGVEGAIETAVFHAWETVHDIRAGRFQPQAPDGGCPHYCPAAAFCWQYAPRSY